jgi:hypothetical protein
LPVIVYCLQAIIYLAGLEDETIFFAVCNNILELIIICHNGGKNR